jgi:hypothetical protein
MNIQIAKSKSLNLAAVVAGLGRHLVMGLLLWLPLHASAEYQRLEAIVAVVDDDVVLASELMAPARHGAPVDD